VQMAKPADGAARLTELRTTQQLIAATHVPFSGETFKIFPLAECESDCREGDFRLSIALCRQGRNVPRP
jgi:hypothetical protein